MPRMPTEAARRAMILKQLETEKGRRAFRLLGELVPQITHQEALAIRQKRKDAKQAAAVPMAIGIDSFLWNYQTGATGYITDVSETTYTLLTINGEVPVQLVINQNDVSPDGTTGDWWGLTIFIGTRPDSFPKYGAIIVTLFNAIGSDPPNVPSSILDVMALSAQPFARSEYKTVYGYLAFDADPSTAIGVLASSLDGMRGIFLPLNPLFYDIKIVADGNGA